MGTEGESCSVPNKKKSFVGFYTVTPHGAQQLLLEDPYQVMTWCCASCFLALLPQSLHTFGLYVHIQGGLDENS